MSMQKFPWNSMEIGVLMFSMEFHGKCPNPPCKYFPWKSMEKFPWNSMETDVLILHGIPWRFFTRVFGVSQNRHEVSCCRRCTDRNPPHLSLHKEKQLRLSNSKHFRFYSTKKHFISEWYSPKSHEIGSLVVRKGKKNPETHGRIVSLD